jgi:hypothetical protein
VYRPETFSKLHGVSGPSTSRVNRADVTTARGLVRCQRACGIMLYAENRNGLNNVESMHAGSAATTGDHLLGPSLPWRRWSLCRHATSAADLRA